MKLFCFSLLIIFTNVLTDQDDEDFKREISITNALVQYAYSMNNCVVDDDFIANGLEHVIKIMVLSGRYNLEKLNYMFVLVGQLYLGDIKEAVKLLHIFNKVIIYKLEIDDPVALRPNFTNLKMGDLQDERRHLTGKALRNIINRAINSDNLTKLVEERRLAPSGNLKNRIIRVFESEKMDRTTPDVPLYTMCQFIALYTSTQYPTTQLKAEEDKNDNKTCTVTNGALVPYKFVIKKINDIWWQVSDPVKPLKELLRTF